MEKNVGKKESFIIEGLAGQKTLSGSIKVNGAKNAALKAFAAAVLFDGAVELKNVPHTSDIDTISSILEKLGAKVQGKDSIFKVDTSMLKSTDIDRELAAIMRASVVLTGPMLARFGKVTFPAPGGCVIGARHIDLFLSGYEKMGAVIKLDEKECLYSIEASGGLRGATIDFKKISVGATETLMMAAVLAKGKTTLNNCAREPEIVNVAEWLNECGAKISGVGTSVIEIEGTGGKLLKPAVPFITIPDRIEAGSYLILGALCARDLTITNCRPDHLEALTSLLIDAGVPIQIKKLGARSLEQGEIRIVGNTNPNSSFKSFTVKTQEYPGFATDLQPIIAVFLTQVSGKSKIEETIYEGRFKYVDDLIKMVADIKAVDEHQILVKGPTDFHQLPESQELCAHDIRAGFAIVMAALVGQGSFTVNNVHLIDRGYEKLEERLGKLGAKIKRISI
jgi:UDP-N-acetylglucosamine 1-carboxyvinyltransferase